MTPERLRDLKFQVRRHMNGEVAQIMKGLDDSYEANYGMSIQHARDIANAESLSADDCTELWSTGWRDLMLIAAAAMGRHNPPASVMAEWAKGVPTVEMADALPFLLAGGVADVNTLAAMLLARDEGFDFAMAANFLARALAAHPFAGSVEPVVAMSTSLLLLSVVRAEWTFAEAKSISFLARQCCRLRRSGGSFDYCSVVAVGRLRASASGRADSASRVVADDIDAEVDMLSTSL
ncbi:MAG: hypothetical protein ACI35Q_06295 [Marinilabiliaceae bacterium]